MPPAPHIQGVLLDIDGTLVDSNNAHAYAWVQAFAEHGITVDFGAVRRCIGMGSDKLVPEVARISADGDPGKVISDRRGEIFRTQFLPHLQPFPGVRELLSRMQDAGLKLAVASSAKKSELSELLRICEADEFVEAQTSSDDADRSKPDPDIVHAALDSFALPAGSVIFLGDTPYDVAAGNRAGVRVVALRCGGWNDPDLTGAIAVYDDPADLLAHFDSSPFVRRS